MLSFIEHYYTSSAKSYYNFLLLTKTLSIQGEHPFTPLFICSTCIDCLLEKKAACDNGEYTGFGMKQLELESLPSELLVLCLWTSDLLHPIRVSSCVQQGYVITNKQLIKILNTMSDKSLVRVVSIRDCYYGYYGYELD